MRTQTRYLAVVGVLSFALALVTVLQVRSQAELVRTLTGQDNASVAFTIDEMHRANDALQAQGQALAGQRERLRAGGASAVPAALAEEESRLRVMEGLAGAHGPGVVITVDAPLTALDLEDATNNLRVGGAEAIAVNQRRVVTGTVFLQGGKSISIDGTEVRGPWTLSAIGDPGRLNDAADLMTRSLKADSRVKSAGYRVEPDLQIRATVPLRPFVYGTA